MNVLLWLFLQNTAEVSTSTWDQVLTQIVITVSISVILLFVANLLKPIFNRTDERLKAIDDRLVQGEKERDELRKEQSRLREEIREKNSEILLSLNDIKHQYNELMRVFQTVEASSKEEKTYLKELVNMLQQREK